MNTVRDVLRRLVTLQESPEHPGWPARTSQVLLGCGAHVQLRPLAAKDYPRWRDLRLEDEKLIRPVEPTVEGTWRAAHSRSAYNHQLLTQRRLAAMGALLPLAIDVDGAFAGQLTLGGIERGTSMSCWIGYWVSSRVTGQGVAQAAVALAVDHAFDRVGLHRITATYLPNNPASGRVLHAVGFRHEGLLRRSLHIDGHWLDHVQVSLVDDDYATSAVARLQRRGTLRY
ncbi:GNAT family N-acetyltransferase [Corynebacterium sp. 13CS0277]|uniref:GNAT family N-acetyltransferase n=1 Tax=Corynebacterium sp. 13CS0277 TaxID=2071994 RepID=UPI000D0447E5|nr:GNAT family protein [Corynebacterium sp. 13CS0277]PRQ11045.1 GNAT family N-acetyltransferase [Corynebacterium sp. 13CS0277]